MKVILKTERWRKTIDIKGNNLLARKTQTSWTLWKH